ncbi:MAG: GGDEF domain-containing protein [Rickettsiales bacterium]|nr:GGDEF domain-containing protein [Rickettsiales bacterium]
MADSLENSNKTHIDDLVKQVIAIADQDGTRSEKIPQIETLVNSFIAGEGQDQPPAEADLKQLKQALLTAQISLRVVPQSYVNQAFTVVNQKIRGIDQEKKEAHRATHVGRIGFKKPADPQTEPLVGEPSSTITGRSADALPKLPLGFANSVVEMSKALFEALPEAVQRYIHGLADENRELKAENELLRKSSVTDNLTGLPNRKAFENKATKVIEFMRTDGTHERRRRDGSSTGQLEKPQSCLLFIDCDKFKLINDNFGFTGGDAVLRHIAKTLRGHLRDRDFLARLGGDEFVVVLEGQDASEAQRVIEKLQDAITHSPCNYQGTDIPLSISCGVYEVTPDIVRGLDKANSEIIEHAIEQSDAAKTKNKDRLISHNGQEAKASTVYIEKLQETLAAISPDKKIRMSREDTPKLTPQSLHAIVTGPDGTPAVEYPIR